MSNQSQDNQKKKIDILIKLLNFLDCLVPCYTENNGTRYYALVYYCDGKFEQSTGNNDFVNDFVKYIFKKGKNEKGKDVNYPIYLHRDTVNKVRGECQDCNFCDIVNRYKNFWNKINIELITDKINDPISYNKTQDGKKKISIYQLDNQGPTSVFIWENGKLKPKNCDKDESIFIKDKAYIENIDNQSQNQNQQNQNQKNITESLLELKKLLITETTVKLSKVINNVIEQQIHVDENLLKEAVETILENIDSNMANKNTVELLKVINNVIEQQIHVDENLLKEAVETILKNIDSNIANKNPVELLKVVNNVIKQQILVDRNLLEKAVEIILEKKSISPDPANDAKQIVDKLME
jgi:nucleoid DNA-binding protein